MDSPRVAVHRSLVLYKDVAIVTSGTDIHNMSLHFTLRDPVSTDVAHKQLLVLEKGCLELLTKYPLLVNTISTVTGLH